VTSGRFGIYIHVPFCSHKCDYCAFATWTDRAHLVDRYMEAMRRQAADAVAAGMEPVTSVFVGGGTPSLVDPALLVAVLDELPLAAGAEVTVECNPDFVDALLFERYVAHGVNRVSLGVQSMAPHVLASLGRTHQPANVAAAVALARGAGVERLNLDLIYGGAGESVADWADTVRRTLDLGPDHVSAYALTIEAGTGLYDDPSRHPDDDDQADKYVVADELLSAAGLANYEISNWATPGEACRHNLLYWTGGNYLGLGCAAHSHIDGRRFWAVRTPDRFIDGIEGGRSVEAGSETLDPDARALELLQLQVRLADGVPASALPPEVDHLVDVGSDGRARLNLQGRLLANEVAVRLRAVAE
jgi:putative oxygen-independent coproporphyrinogen III oxidase